MISKLSWIDLPQDDYVQLLGYSSEQVDALNHLIDAYFDLDKEDEDALPLRVERLEDIIEFLTDWIENKTSTVDKIKHLYILKELAEEKRNYLIELVKISQLGDAVSQYQYAYHCPEVEKNDLQVVYLNARRMYSVKKREYWGDFWWVTLDPCHRQLTNYLMVWEEQYKTQKSKAIDFFLWLEKQHVPVGCVYEKYFDAKELAATEIFVRNGLLYRKQGGTFEIANFNQKDKKYLYVIGLDKILRIVEESDTIYHSSFYKGKPVYTAGKIRLIEGRIVSVSFESGHYIPSIKIGYQLLQILQEQGAIFYNTVEVSYFYDRNKYTIMVPTSALTDFYTFSGFIEHKQEIKLCETVG